MAMDILSQAEIDALLTGVDEGEVETEAGLAPRGGRGVRAYDFTSQERIVRGRLPTLEMINERFARAFRIRLVSMLRRTVEISIEGVRMVKYGEWVHSLFVPTSLTIVHMKPLKGIGVFMMESRLVYTLVDNFFGGSGRHAKIEGREFTPTELRVVHRVLQIAFDEMQKAWHSVLPVRFELVSHEMNPQLANIVAPSEVVAVCAFRIELEGGGGQFHLTIPYNMIEPIRDLLDAGVHFGHQLRRFNPKAKKFVFANRNGISVIDLEKTHACLAAAAKFVEETVAGGKQILLVGTKRQARDLIKEAAVATGMPYATTRWLGGTLTNFVTVHRSIEKYKQYLRWESDGTLDKMPNKESSAIRREMARMSRNFEGITELNEMPGAVFVVDTKTEEIAVREANRLKIPVVALVDTNSDPTIIQYPIPGNDDSIKSVRLIVEAITDAIQAGLAQRAQPEVIQPRTVKPIVESHAQEIQVPVTAIRAEDDDADFIPEKFSTDED